MGDDRDAWDFFLAHAGPDADRAVALYELLAPQARVFLDSRILKLGDDWDAELSRAQRRSLITVVLVSPSTDKAYYQREEIAAAIAMARDDEIKHRVVPIYLEGLTSDKAIDLVPYGLRLKHGLPTAKGDTLVAAAGKLLELLGQLTGRSFGPVEKATPPSGATSGERPAHTTDPALLNETLLSESSVSRVRKGRHPVHGMVLVKDLLSIPDESLDLVASRHYRTLMGDRLIDVGRREEGTFYEILREIPGHDLSSVVQKNNVIAGALLDDIALQVLKQLATLHGAPRPVIHRDVRPTNLILSFERDDMASAQKVRYKPVVRLIDYDTACFENDRQTPWGAHGFTAPEQREGRAVPSSDLFSLVSTLYFLATANVPPDASSWPGQAAPPFETLLLANGTRISEVYGHRSLLRCWSYNVSERPASAVAFLDKNPVPGTKFLPPPKRLGTFAAGGEWQVDLFDSYYEVTPTAS